MQHAPVLLNEASVVDDRAAPSSVRVPHLTVAAFIQTAATRDAIERASADRRLTRVKTEMTEGGITQACKTFETRRTPSLLVVEATTGGDTLLQELDALAEVCHPDTKVVVIGVENDIALYRTLMARGIAEYLVGTITPLVYVATVQELFAEGAATKLGSVYAFVAAKGGVGASTLAQNIAWTIAEEEASPTLLLDLDLRFGSTAVNLDLKPVTGLEKYVDDPEKLDSALLDRLIVQRGEYLSVLPGFEDPLSEAHPATGVIERMIEIARGSFPRVVLDLPHDWSDVSRDALISADEVVIVAAPDLPNLRNTRAIMERLRALRPNDAPPRVVLNTCRMPKRKEIPAEKFAKSVGVESCAIITFDAGTFGTAAAEGRALRETASRGKAQCAVQALAQTLTGRGKPRPRGRLRRLFSHG
ncbi:AAA family ATPase [Roseovarius tibetensis]|uniref:AAA family ATPase n=1 Tax=Roseovarius tibetensis TaxID=2685897 RepID=UPI003D7FADDA